MQPEKNQEDLSRDDTTSATQIVRTFQTDAAHVSGDTPEKNVAPTEFIPRATTPLDARPAENIRTIPKEPPQKTEETSPTQFHKEDQLRIEEIKARLQKDISPEIQTSDTGTGTPPKKTPETLARIHTYSSDTAHTMKSRGADKLSIVAEEQDNREQYDGPREKKTISQKTILGVTFGILLILIALSTIAYVFFIREEAPEVQMVERFPTPIFINSEVRVQNIPRDGLRERVRNALMWGSGEAPGSIKNIAIVQEVILDTGIALAPVPLSQTFDTLAGEPPSLLVRAVRPESMIGSFFGKRRGEFIFILSLESFERGFSGMLSWEGTIARDLAPLVGQTTLVRAPSSTPSEGHVGTTTTPVTPLPEPKFEDALIQNHDVRILRRGDDVFLVYGFRNRTTLVIAESIEAFTETMTRLATTHTTTQ